MSDVLLEKKLTWGGILTIGTILLTAGINWGIADSTAKATAAEVAIVRTSVRELETARYSDNGRMVRMETLLTEILEEVKGNR